MPGGICFLDAAEQQIPGFARDDKLEAYELVVNGLADKAYA
jgi:hypothetical protein